jgi:hypothetical protein
MTGDARRLALFILCAFILPVLPQHSRACFGLPAPQPMFLFAEWWLLPYLSPSETPPLVADQQAPLPELISQAVQVELGLAPEKGPAVSTQPDVEAEEELPKKVHNEVQGPWGNVSAQTLLNDPSDPASRRRADPLAGSAWRTEENLKVNLLGPLFVFGEFGANPAPVLLEELEMQTRTGIGCKLPEVVGMEVQVRSGPVMSTDLGSAHATGRLSQWLFEVQCRYPLWSNTALEYQGSAAPALTTQDHDHISQDLRLAVPLGTAAKFQVGARHEWEGDLTARNSSSTSRSWADGMQLYLGFEIKGK